MNLIAHHEGVDGLTIRRLSANASYQRIRHLGRLCPSLVRVVEVFSDASPSK
jgi:hypothetical protein